eukprot:194336_1
MDSCRICNKRQISRLQRNHNQPQFDIYTVLKYKNFNIGSKPHETDTEFTLHSLYEYLRKCAVNNDYLIAFKDYLNTQEYDSDAVMQDISNEDEKQS